ncbi:kinase-like domain-containing protein [Thelephora terrestris]|uniref:Kinase-like domain-containing protein n=1 Tax=Thelephora terrestris TaxID=56493 RepID=A0A9P6HKL6_9AGAM|nr:kinase-like domain-containing protein [Thelephora terrestris]
MRPRRGREYITRMLPNSQSSRHCLSNVHTGNPRSSHPTSSSPFLEMFGAKKRGGNSFRATIDALELKSRSIANKTEAKRLVERLNELMAKTRDEGEEENCLRVLIKVCREQAVLPKSYIISNVRLGEPLNRTVPDIRTGKIGETGIFKRFRVKVLWKTGKLEKTGQAGESDICIKVFRHDENQQAFKGAVYGLVVRWKNVSHPNVLPLLGVSDVIPPFGLVTSRMSGNIKEYTQEHQVVDRILLLSNAACGLEYLHSLDIIHGRIHPRNILITGQGVACIGDFGIAEIINNSLLASQSRTATRQQGGTRYMALEQVKDSSTGKESDVHSFAITAYEVLVRVEPYRGITGEGPLCMRISNGTPPFGVEAAAVGELPDEIRRMLESCWVPERSKRPTIEKVHRELQGSRSSQQEDGKRMVPNDEPHLPEAR